MKVKILAFGVAKDIFQHPSVVLDMEEGTTVEVLKKSLEERFPRLNQLSSYMIAVNNEYAAGGDTIDQADEIALIPPVSGG